MGAGVATSPRFPRVSRPRVPGGTGFMSALGRFRAALRKAEAPCSRPRLPRQSPKALPVRRSGASPKGFCPSRPHRIRHRPGEWTPERPSCRVRDRRSPPSPSAAARKEPPFPRPRRLAPGGSRPVRVRIGRTFDTAVSVRVSIVPPGFCRGCRARLGRGFHLAAAVAAVSSAALALHDPLPKARPAPAMPWNLPSVSGPAVPGHTRKLSRFPSRGKSRVPVDNEDNGDGMN
jgi:hypothetical protein